ncbi:hypothetical protein RRG08_039585 [Elysia crispata]|uniref:Uncharacterized protein n=1 Tax=Elysia crispata TaxID=231223 RepID=A0AAE1AJP2_9GAST|nr:hypothetical protein RRG08_039585 [Elysia crispata]
MFAGKTPRLLTEGNTCLAERLGKENISPHSFGLKVREENVDWRGQDTDKPRKESRRFMEASRIRLTGCLRFTTRATRNRQTAFDHLPTVREVDVLTRLAGSKFANLS